MKTVAAILQNINKPLIIEELVLPDLQSGQVLVKIAYSGVCHSQLNEIYGLKGEDKFLPHTLGHEGSGVVEAVGRDVRKVVPGDHVVLTWIRGKGIDVSSSKYTRKDGSVVNSGAISTFLSKAIISENRLVKIPRLMPLREVALLGCAIPTGGGIVKNTLNIKSSESLAIFGMGGIGLSALLVAKVFKVKKIIAVDINDSKLEYARRLGATDTINSNGRQAVNEIFKITDGIGVDYAIESAGKKESMENAFRSVRDKGGVCVIAGNLPDGVEISISPFDLIKGKKMIGTWGGETEPDVDIPEYARLLSKDGINLGDLVTNVFKIENINEAFDLLRTGTAGRILIEFGNE